MQFPSPLVPARLIRRYKRFLADCRLEDGREEVAHCANPGSMMGLAEPGMKIWLEPNDDPKKKLKFGWRLVDHENGHLTGVDTSVPNRALRAALEARSVPGLANYHSVRPEVKYGDNSRIDFLLEGDALFPDSVTARGTKHLGELEHMVAQGHRAVMLYLVQRTDCDQFDLARDIDPAYGAAFDDARAAGVKIIVLGTRINPEGIEIAGPLVSLA